MLRRGRPPRLTLVAAKLEPKKTAALLLLGFDELDNPIAVDRQTKVL